MSKSIIPINIFLQIIFILALLQLHAPLNIAWLVPICTFFIARWSSKLTYEPLRTLLLVIVLCGIGIQSVAICLALQWTWQIAIVFFIIGIVNGVLPYYSSKKYTYTHTITLKDYTLK